MEKENYIYQDGVLIFLNDNDEEIGKYTCNNKDENLCFVAYYNLEDNFDVEQNIYPDGAKIERRSTIYLDKYVFINDSKNNNDNTIKLYNIEEEKVEDNYSLVKGFNDSNYVILKDTNGKYGVLLFDNDNYKELLEFSYDYVGELNKEAKFVVKTNNKYYIFNKNGKNESKGLPYEIKSYNNNYIVVYDDGYYVYGVFDMVFRPVDDNFAYINLQMVRNAEDYNIQNVGASGTEYGRKLDINKVKTTIIPITKI